MALIADHSWSLLDRSIARPVFCNEGRLSASTVRVARVVWELVNKLVETVGSLRFQTLVFSYWCLHRLVFLNNFWRSWGCWSDGSLFLFLGCDWLLWIVLKLLFCAWVFAKECSLCCTFWTIAESTCIKWAILVCNRLWNSSYIVYGLINFFSQRLNNLELANRRRIAFNILVFNSNRFLLLDWIYLNWLLFAMSLSILTKS